MPRKRSEQPAYSYHTSGQARVRLGHEVFYLGKHGSPESYARYYSLLAEYNANGKQAPEKAEDEGEAEAVRLADSVVRVKHITADFRARVLPLHESNPANQSKYANLCDFLDERHGDEPAEEFGPRKLEAMRDVLIARGIGKKHRPNSRPYANDQARKIIKIIEHGVSRELVSPERIVALRSLPPLRRGQARENPKRKGVSLETVQATLPHLTSTAAAMVRLQLATAMRPSEMFSMTPSMIDRSGEVWFYRPARHKTEHHGKEKAVPILGDALEALTPFLFGDADQPCFMTEKGTAWNKDAFRIAIRRAAKAAKAEHWTPYQIRHTSLQAVRDVQGPEGAQALAGHSRLSTTEIYAKVSELKAIEAAKVAPRLTNG
ncbi:tyrosine-type recombinase/integrase [Allorhodopirellula solitaria]|uniref:Site-specific tyrosine recombinase XerC n=1 Tax=Allorhodopirellula solitaria TaxID=2527987 RepID=A0A5C5X039_9BACT|nr:tyrosine-type recombinase/integrase [Allorhodopirellula solitaria]TWT56514.1 site-specific tyrosine recombinase XerC [Allorhodopirellula solitaria]